MMSTSNYIFSHILPPYESFVMTKATISISHFTSSFIPSFLSLIRFRVQSYVIRAGVSQGNLVKREKCGVKRSVRFLAGSVDLCPSAECSLAHSGSCS